MCLKGECGLQAAWRYFASSRSEFKQNLSWKRIKKAPFGVGSCLRPPAETLRGALHDKDSGWIVVLKEVPGILIRPASLDQKVQAEPGGVEVQRSETNLASATKHQAGGQSWVVAVGGGANFHAGYQVIVAVADMTCNSAADCLGERSDLSRLGTGDFTCTPQSAREAGGS